MGIADDRGSGGAGARSLVGAGAGLFWGKHGPDRIGKNCLELAVVGVHTAGGAVSVADSPRTGLHFAEQ